MTDTRIPAATPAATDQPGVEESPAEPRSMPDQADPPVSEHPARDPRLRTRISGTWVGILIAAVLLVLLLVFILQNMKSVKVSYFTANGHIPLGIVLTFAFAVGVLLSGVVASLRILQIRRSIGKTPAQPSRPPQAAPAVTAGMEESSSLREDARPAESVIDPA